MTQFLKYSVSALLTTLFLTCAAQSLRASNLTSEKNPQISDSQSNSQVDSRTANLQIASLENHWAKPFIEKLAAQNLLDIPTSKIFQPEQVVSRAQLAAILQLAFLTQNTNYVTQRRWQGFDDVPPDHWAASAIMQTYESGILSGYNSRSFHPDEPVTKAQVLVAIANSLKLNNHKTNTPHSYLLTMYRDASQIPEFAVQSIATLTERGLVVNYPDPRVIAANGNVTKAELAALVYEALADQGRLPKIGSLYAIDPNRPLFTVAIAQVTRLEVSLSKRTVTAYQGDVKLKSYPIAVGRAGWETPLGTHRVLQMIEYPAWKNPFTGDVIQGADPENPLGERWIGFWTNGEDWSGFHGTPNRASVGQAVSHGCIRMYNEDIRELFTQVSPDTVVQVSN
ncbi:S-layer homology domain-containing protein [Tumidithrix elongata RA019]|uniref:S-layer homology domain-containing protein n=1 Tax=Tumidithrix elongata BACA0141 TaxID=2716417 RepID=A0AAW9PU76_9CYAN|nr:S-layer homology domain-containing protein [Tumidithrix elongata RA019]